MRNSVLTTLSICFLIVISFSFNAFAQYPDIRLSGIGPRIGYVDPESGLDGTIELGVDFELGEWAKQLEWDASLSYWNSTQEFRYVNTTYDWSLSDVAIRTGVNYHFVKGDWEPFAGGGLGLHFYSWGYDGYGADADNSEFGIYIDGGVEHEFNKNWSGSAQLLLDFADVDQTAIMLQATYNFPR